MSELFVPMAVFAAMVLKLTDLLKFAKNRDVNGVATIALAWVAGFVVALLFAQSAWAKGIVFGDQTLAGLNLASLVIIGFAASSVGGVLFDFKKALDGTDSAAVPSLLSPTSTAAVPGAAAGGTPAVLDGR